MMSSSVFSGRRDQKKMLLVAVLIVAFVVVGYVAYQSTSRKPVVLVEDQRTKELRAQYAHYKGDDTTVDMPSDAESRLVEVTKKPEPHVMGLWDTLNTCDANGIEKQYWDNDEALIVPNFLSKETHDKLLECAERLKPKINRNFVPNFKKGGSVSYHEIRRSAPELVDIYSHPALIEFVNKVTHSRVQLCPPSDPHSCALYYYMEEGDWIDWHYDTSFYKGTRYTMLMSITQKSSSKLMCRFHTKNPNHAPVDLESNTTPGTLVLFHGDKLWHKVTPSKAGEERIILTLEFVTDPSMGPLDRLVSTVKDGIGYFGVKAALKSYFNSS